MDALVPDRPWLSRRVAALFRPLDRLFNRLYSSRFNPLYLSGTYAVLFLTVASVSGVYLFVLYSCSDPWGSVEVIQAQWWGGRWIRALHRYSADGAVVAVAVHVLRMIASGRTWGPRTLAWLSGVVLLALMLLTGWVGYIMVWDVQAQVTTLGLVDLIDLLPLFSEPLRRLFAGDAPVPVAFFFMNLFLHVATPLGLIFLYWLHTSRLARPGLFPERPALWATVGLLILVSLLFPLPLQRQADLLADPGVIEVDLMYGFWIPFAHWDGAWATAVVLAGGALVTMTVPLWLRPAPSRRGHPSAGNEQLCTGCFQCYLDCPYEAIQMVPRRDGSRRSAAVALVDPELCVSCGICAASCGPMAIGPPGRTGRDQLAALRAWLGEVEKDLPASIVVFGCRWSAAAQLSGGVEDCLLRLTGCAGSLHSFMVELVLRRGALGVVVLSCPPRDCSYREGPRWTQERLFEGREAELKERVDRRRLLLLHHAPGEGAAAARAIETFRRELEALARPKAADRVELDLDCDRIVAVEE